MKSNPHFPVLALSLDAKLGVYPGTTLRDLKKRGYAIGRTRTASRQWGASVTHAEADRYLAERELEMTSVLR